MRGQILRACGAALTALALLASAAWAAPPVRVCVSILPQKTFVEQIGGDRVAVDVMVAPGASPHTYEPRPRQMAALAGTRVYFAVGVPFEQAWLPRIAAANPDLRVVHTEAGIDKIAMEAHSDHGEEHPGAGAAPAAAEAHHRHQGLDPHVWLAPPLVVIQGRAIRDALVALDPAYRAHFEARFDAFRQRLENLDADLRRLFGARPGAQFLVFHPSWGYFARAYGLTQVPIEIEGKEPKPAQLQQLIAQAREKGIRVVFVQPQFSRRSASMVAREIGGRVVPADPLAEDWEGSLRAAAAAFEEALR